MCHLTLMPASRAASGLPPTAIVRRPKVVRLSSTQPTTATSAKMKTEISIPRICLSKKSANPETWTIWVFLFEMISARPRALASIASVMMNGTIPP